MAIRELSVSVILYKIRVFHEFNHFLIRIAHFYFYSFYFVITVGTDVFLYPLKSLDLGIPEPPVCVCYFIS